MAEAGDFGALVSALEGERISHAWKGYGSAIFLEVGTLVQNEGNPRGDSCISLEWDWRIDDGIQIVGGSSESGNRIMNSVRSLIGLEISTIETSDPPHEICVFLSDNRRIRSMAAVSGDPQWSIRFADGRWLSAASGTLSFDDGSIGCSMTGSERAVLDHAKETASRWGIPERERVKERCQNCQSFIPLDGNFDLLDFGACTSDKSPMDRRVTNNRDGCEAFSPKR